MDKFCHTIVLIENENILPFKIISSHNIPTAMLSSSENEQHDKVIGTHPHTQNILSLSPFVFSFDSGTARR